MLVQNLWERILVRAHNTVETNVNHHKHETEFFASHLLLRGN